MTDPFELSIFERLAEPFVPEQVHWRVGPTNKKFWKEGDKKRGQPLAYIDARDVMDRFDSVCGPNGWQDEYSAIGNATCCRIGVALHETDTDRNAVWIWKSDGAGQTDMEGDKGQFSDAFKRAAVKFGVGRYLYDCNVPWIDLDDRWNIPKGNSGLFERELEKAANRQLWGDRTAYNMYRFAREALRKFCESSGKLDEFVASKAELIASLKAGAKRELENEINRIKDDLSQKDKAA